MIKQNFIKYKFQIDSRFSNREWDVNGFETNPVLNVNAICWRANDVFTLDILIAWQQSTTKILNLLIEK